MFMPTAVVDIRANRKYIMIMKLIGLAWVVTHLIKIKFVSGLGFSIGTEEESVDRTDAITMSVVRWELFRYHQSNIMLLEQECFIGNCPFVRAKQIIRDGRKATEYWNFLNCVKFGNTCPRNGQWGKWGKYESCSTRCGEGIQVRWRDCNSPRPLFGGVYCKGMDHESIPCVHNEGSQCAFNPGVPGVWGSWGPWSHCEGRKFERGVKKRVRHCLPNNKTSDCESYPEQYVTCRRAVPRLNGAWSHWEHWSVCTTEHTCGGGVRTRRRLCSEPYQSGDGVDCAGESAQTIKCLSTLCDIASPKLAHFLPDSYLRYKAVPMSYYLNVFLKFMPNSDGGMLFQYSTESALHEATKSGSVKIKKKKVPSFVNFQEKEDSTVEAKVKQIYQPVEIEDYVYAVLDSANEIKVHIHLNKSEPITVSLHGVKNSEWNELRVTIVSDMIWIRLNDGENIEARLEEFLDSEIPVSNTSGVVTGFITRMTNKVKSAVMDLFNPDRRQILAVFDGEMGLGAVRKDHQGFRGYVSHFIINYQSYTLKAKRQEEISKNWDPFRENRITHGGGILSDLSTLTHFNGRQAIQLPLIASWINSAGIGIPVGKLPGQVGTFELVLMPECDDGVFFFIQCASNRFTHWKLSVDETRKVRLAMSYGGEITLLKTGPDLNAGKWNKVVLQLVSAGRAHLKVNEHSYYVEMPNALEEHRALPIIHIGGYGKPTEHDELLGKNPSPDMIKEFKSFRGYIYSIKQDDTLYSLYDIPQENTFHMQSSFFMSKTHGIDTIFFLPASTDKKEVSDSDDLLAWEEHADKRSLMCNVPIPKNVQRRGNVSWYRNDQKIKESNLHWTHTFVSEQSQVSSLFMGKSLDSSQDHAGIYQCVLTYFGYSHLVMTFVAAVLPDDVAHYGLGGLGWIFRGFSVEMSILIMAGACIGALIVLLLLLGCIRCIFRNIAKWRKSKSAEKTQETIPLTKISKSSVKSTGSSKKHSHSSHSSSDSETKPKITFSRLASNVKKVGAFRVKPKPSFRKITSVAKYAEKLKKKMLSREEKFPLVDLGSSSSKESQSLIDNDDIESSSEEETVLKMGSLVKVNPGRKKRRNTLFDDKLE